MGQGRHTLRSINDPVYLTTTYTGSLRSELIGLIVIDSASLRRVVSL